MPQIRRVGVLGCGLMGSGIAQICARAGYDTSVWEVSEPALERGMDRVRRQLDRAVASAKLTAEERESTLALIRGGTSLEALAGCDLVVEAVVEELEVKNQLWRTLDGLCPRETIFASNTSSLNISDMAAATGRPERVVGLHFFNPVPVMQLVEVVRTVATDEEIVETALHFVRSLGKEAIVCRDRSGFVVNLLLVPFMMDAIRALEEGVASVDEIDKAMRLGASHPMGPLTLCDFVGNDTLARIGDIMFLEYREQRYAPPPLLRRMVTLGHHGRKSGRGFYDYSQDPPLPVDHGR